MGFHIDPRDERLQAPLDTPLWRESFWLDAHDVEQNLSLVIYAHARPASCQGDLFVCIAGPGIGRIEHDVQNLPYAGPHEGLIATVGGLRHEFSRPSKEVAFSLNLPQAQIDLGFAAEGPVYDYDWERWTASRHIEQFGKVQGSLVTPQGTFAFTGRATRDHAWGARAKVPWRRWVWITTRFRGGQGWSACIVDAEKSLLLGYISEATYEETTFASLRLNQPGGSLSSAELTLRSLSFETQAHIKPRVVMPRSGTDSAKGGTYHYYFVDVEDRRYGKGQGLLNIYTTPGHDLHDGDVIASSGPP